MYASREWLNNAGEVIVTNIASKTFDCILYILQKYRDITKELYELWI